MKPLPLLILLISTCPLFVNGQVYNWKFHFRNYSIGEGLPSVETYDVVTDNRGFLYISTDRGVVRFDGKQFVQIRFASYSKDYTLFEFTKDETGRIWCTSYDQGLFYLKNDQLHPYRYNDTLNKFRGEGVLEDICIDKSGDLYFYTRNFDNTIGKIDSGGNFYYVAAVKEAKNGCQGFFHAGKIIPLLLGSRGGIPDLPRIHSPAIKPIQNIPLLPDSLSIQKVHGRSTPFGEFIAASNILAVSYTGQHAPFHRYFPHEVLSFELVDTTLWVATRGGLYYFPSLFDLEKYEIYFAGLGFNGICSDHQGGLWFTSLQQGVFHLPSRQVSVLDFPDHIGEFSIGVDTLLTFYKTRNAVYSAFIGKSKQLYVSKKGERENWEKEAGIYVRRICPLSGDISALCLSGGFMLYSHAQQAVYFDSREQNHFTERVLSMELFRDTFWIGTASGIYTMADKDIERWEPGEKTLQIKISDLKACGDETLWIATLGQGLYSYDSVLRPRPEVSVAFIESIYIDNDEDIWVGSNAGIFSRIARKWYFFAANSGLPSPYVRKVVYKNREVYGLAGSKLFRFSLDKRKLKDLTPYAKFQARLFIDGKRREYRETEEKEVILTEKERRFRLFMNNPNFESPGYAVTYRLAGKDTGWTGVEGNTLSLMDMAPGNYAVQVRYTEKITPTDPHEFTVNLVKEPEWTQTTAFQLLLVVLGGLFTIPPGILIFRGLLEKRKLYYEKILADQRVLSTQLNPHFTYNALNSMQLLLYEKKWKRALAYNEGLGKVLRRIFRQSEKTFISLTRELDLVKEYVELEKVRLRRQVDFTLAIGENTNPAVIPVPPLLIQPLVENAIWHGYGEKSQYLIIRCAVEEKSGNKVCISVSDNGEGFDQSRDNQTHSALKNMIHRIELLNSSRLVHIDIETFSPLRSDGKPGTEITITILYLYEKESDHYRR